MKTIQEPARETPISAEYDVVVAGGGIAGIAAALAAARNGARTALLEKECALGGLATLGLISIYLPLCDGKGRQVIFGLGEELLRLSVKHGAQGHYPEAWLDGGSAEDRMAQRFLAQFNPQLFSMEAEGLLQALGVDLWFDTRIAAAAQAHGRVGAVVVEHKTGRQAILTKAVVDATGDADLCMLAGLQTVACHTNRLAMWYTADTSRGNQLRPGGVPLNQPLPEIERYYGSLSRAEMTQMLTEGRRRMLLDFLQNRQRPQDFPTHLPLLPLLRMTRRLVGEYELDDSDMGYDFEDSVGMTGDWRKAGPVYMIPLRALYSASCGNLLVAGRAISVSESAWDITRVTPASAVTGEAAGTAAALVARTGALVQALPIATLQDALRKQGVRTRQSELS